TLVETRLTDVKDAEMFNPVETIDFSEVSYPSVSEWAAEWVSADMWVENPAVITRTFQPLKMEIVPETENIRVTESAEDTEAEYETEH
ncbi:MAG: hypothetical protein Q4C70_14945, partial [Planctomycetia bacterium]|nr:hypothetical protein [Planctomycetia bacterium]